MKYRPSIPQSQTRRKKTGPASTRCRCTSVPGTNIMINPRAARREGSGLNNVLAAPVPQLALQQLLKQLDSEVALRHAADLGQELVREDRDVRPLEARGGENVQHLIRHDGLRDIQISVRIYYLGFTAGKDQKVWKKLSGLFYFSDIGKEVKTYCFTYVLSKGY